MAWKHKSQPEAEAGRGIQGCDDERGESSASLSVNTEPEYKNEYVLRNNKLEFAREVCWESVLFSGLGYN